MTCCHAMFVAVSLIEHSHLQAKTSQKIKRETFHCSLTQISAQMTDLK